MKKTVTLVFIAFVSLILLFGYSLNVNSSLSQAIVRLHVVANSDSDADQELKLKVRDAVLAYSQADFTKKSDIESSLDEYKKIAEQVIKENGFSYPASVEYGKFSFPTKHYKNLSLPAGSYDAVRISLGEAKGKNWWCVLFPPLCFVDGTTGQQGATDKLKSMLTDEHYDLITAYQNGGGVPVEIKFKIAELCGLLYTREKVYLKAGKD